MSTKRQAEMPFYESAEDASYSAILKSHKAPKEIAHAIWPALKLDTAYARLMGALKHARPEKLTADEHILIANYCGQYDFLYYIEIQCHHAGSVLLAPEDEAAQLQREYIQSVKAQTQITKRLERIMGVRGVA